MFFASVRCCGHLAVNPRLCRGRIRRRESSLEAVTVDAIDVRRASAVHELLPNVDTESEKSDAETSKLSTLLRDYPERWITWLVGR